MNRLFVKPASARACGKSILMGEHAVVYGYTALATALPDVRLVMTCANPEDVCPSWEEAWEIVLQGQIVPVTARWAQLLQAALERALHCVGINTPVQAFQPQKIRVDSRIPLGGGMGGSAAISTCLARLAAQAVGRVLSYDEQLAYGNQVEQIFHSGKASGLDVCAIVNDGIIAFQKGHPPRPIVPKVGFWLALVDSGERCETAAMIQHVAAYAQRDSTFVTSQLQQMHAYACQGLELLEQGALVDFGGLLNLCHQNLSALGVSTVRVDALATELRQAGALGSKLTGAGGGGLVLAIFADCPTPFLELYPARDVYVSFLPGKTDAGPTKPL